MENAVIPTHKTHESQGWILDLKLGGATACPGLKNRVCVCMWCVCVCVCGIYRVCGIYQIS